MNPLAQVAQAKLELVRALGHKHTTPEVAAIIQKALDQLNVVLGKKPPMGIRHG